MSDVTGQRSGLYLAESDRMEIRVKHEDGRTEVLSLRGAWKVIEGKELNRLKSDEGFEHFFTKDGFYDCWGAGITEPAPQVNGVLNALEAKRRFVD